MSGIGTNWQGNDNEKFVIEILRLTQVYLLSTKALLKLPIYVAGRSFLKGAVRFL
jgi:hypothetical protein